MASVSVNYGPSGNKKKTQTVVKTGEVASPYVIPKTNYTSVRGTSQTPVPTRQAATGQFKTGGAYALTNSPVLQAQARAVEAAAQGLTAGKTQPTNTNSYSTRPSYAQNVPDTSKVSTIKTGGGGGGTDDTNKPPVVTDYDDNRPVYDGNSGGGSSSGGGSTSSTSRQSVRTDMDATVPDNTGAQLFDLYQRYLDDLRNQANTAYNLNMERIRQAYDSNRRTIDDVYSGSQGQLRNAYDKSSRGVRDDSEQALRESYINYMMSRKNLGQELSALGLNGGEAETTLGSLLNNYGNSRNAIETTRNKNLSNLGDALQSGLAQAQQNYSSALQSLINNRLNAENAAENARQNLLANFATNLSDLSISNEPYINAIKSLAETVTGVPITATQATNPYEGTSIRQGGAPFTPASGNPYARFIAQANMMRQGGSSDDDIKNYLFGAVGNDSNALTQIFADLGLA